MIRIEIIDEDGSRRQLEEGLVFEVHQDREIGLHVGTEDPEVIMFCCDVLLNALCEMDMVSKYQQHLKECIQAGKE